MHAVPKRTVYHSLFNEALLRCWILVVLVDLMEKLPNKQQMQQIFLTLSSSSGDDDREPMCQLLDALTRDEAHNLLIIWWRCVACVSP